MKEFYHFMDLTGKDRHLDCFYHGVYSLELEGRIMEEDDDSLTLGVSLHRDDVQVHSYNPAQQSLDIWYRPSEPGVIRTRILPMEKFEVPQDVQEINVYDA